MPGRFDFVGFLGILLICAELIGVVVALNWIYYRVRAWKRSRAKTEE